MQQTSFASVTCRTQVERWPLAAPFRTTGFVRTFVDVIVVMLEKDGCVGRGEATGVRYRGETVDSMLRQIDSCKQLLITGIDRVSLKAALPAGGARNALDCALWDLHAKTAGLPAWQLAELDPPTPVICVVTCGADRPEVMAADAQRHQHVKALKLKLTGEDMDADRIRAVREVRPEVWLTVDANQGLTRETLERLMPVLVECRVALIEQPFLAGQEQMLDGLHSPIPIAADESAQDLSDLPGLVGRFDVVNIKLDKCGGLTTGFEMARAASALGLRSWVGNTVGTSLAMAPAFLLGQVCDHVELDGPIFLANDRAHRIEYADGAARCPDELWGNAVPVPGGAPLASKPTLDSEPDANRRDQ